MRSGELPGVLQQVAECIAYLRADLAATREMLRLYSGASEPATLEQMEADLEAERARSWSQAEQRVEEEDAMDQAIANAENEQAIAENYASDLGIEKRQAEERAAHAEAQCAAMRVSLETATDILDAYNLNPRIKASYIVADLREALVADPSHLLTAVRRLMEAARIQLARHAAASFGHCPTCTALRNALADPALAGLRGAS